jgi:hypothetical protein
MSMVCLKEGRPGYLAAAQSAGAPAVQSAGAPAVQKGTVLAAAHKAAAVHMVAAAVHMVAADHMAPAAMAVHSGIQAAEARRQAVLVA